MPLHSSSVRRRFCLRSHPLFGRLRRFRPAVAGGLGLALAAILVPRSEATTYFWTGGGGTGNTNWSTAANWSTSAPPSDLANTDLVFGASAFTLTNLNQAYSVHSLTINAGGAAYTFSGSDLTLGSGGLIQNAPTPQTFNNAVILGTDQTWTLGFGAGALTFNGGVNTTSGFGASHALTINAATPGSNGNVINGAITGDGSLTKTGAGTLILNGANTYRGTTTVGAGTLAINGSLGASNTNFTDLVVTGTTTAAATLNLNSGSSVTMSHAYIGYDGTGTVNQSGGTLTIGTTNSFYVGYVTGGQGTYNLSGGTLNAKGLFVGNDSVGIFNQTGGNLTNSGFNLVLGRNASSSGTYTLTGGTLTTSGVAGGTGTSTFNFNGGTLLAASSSTGFFQGMTTANVQTGGVQLDTAGFSVTVAQALLHDTTAGAAAADGGLTKRGAGTLTLTGTSTYAGITNISAGTLQVGNGGTSGSLGAGNITDSGALIFNRSDSVTVASVIGGNGSLTQAGSGILTINGNNTYSGGTTFAGGSLVVNNTGALGNQGTLSFTGGTLRYSAANQTDYSGRFSTAPNQAVAINTNGQTVTFATALVSAGGSLTKSGLGTLTLTGANTHTGNTTVSAGTLAITGSLNSGSGATLTVDGAPGLSTTFSLSAAATSLSTGVVNVGSTGLGSITQGGGNFTANGGGLYLGTNADAGGAFTLNGGSLSTGSAYVGSSGTGIFNQSNGSFTTNGNPLYLGLNAAGIGTYTLSGGSLSTGFAYVGSSGRGTVNQSAGTVTTNGNPLILGGEANSNGTYTLSGTGSLSTGTVFLGFHGNGAFTQTGGTFTTNGPNPLLLGNDAGISGTYTLTGGTLTAGAITAGSGTSTFNFNGGTLQPGISNAAFFQGLTTINVQTGGARVDTGGFNVSVAQPLLHDTTAGAPTLDGGLTKSGAGALTLSGANTYSGPTAVSAGTLAINGSLAGTGTVTVAGNATLAGTGTIAGSVQVQANGAFSPGQLGAGRLTLNSSLTLTGAATAAFTLGGTAANPQSTQALVGGQINLGTTATLSLTLASGYTPVLGNKFYLLDDTGTLAVSGSFANAPATGSTFALGGVTYLISYQDSDPNDPSHTPGNDVSLTVVAVPEPSAWAMLSLGAGLLVLTLRRRAVRA